MPEKVSDASISEGFVNQPDPVESGIALHPCMVNHPAEGKLSPPASCRVEQILSNIKMMVHAAELGNGRHPPPPSCSTSALLGQHNLGLPGATHLGKLASTVQLRTRGRPIDVALADMQATREIIGKCVFTPGAALGRGSSSSLLHDALATTDRSSNKGRHYYGADDGAPIRRAQSLQLHHHQAALFITQPPDISLGTTPAACCIGGRSITSVVECAGGKAFSMDARQQRLTKQQAPFNMARYVQLCTRGRPIDVALTEIRSIRQSIDRGILPPDGTFTRTMGFIDCRFKRHLSNGSSSSVPKRPDGSKDGRSRAISVDDYTHLAQNAIPLKGALRSGGCAAVTTFTTAPVS